MYNSQKSQVMIIDLKKVGYEHNIYLNETPLKYVQNYKYLGHIINNTLSDENDMNAKVRSLYGRSNMLLRNFHFFHLLKTNYLQLIVVIYI